MAKEKTEEKKGLKDYGIIYISGSIDDGTSAEVCREIIEINVAGEVDTIQLIINSAGGSCYAGFAIIDIMEWSRIPIFSRTGSKPFRRWSMKRKSHRTSRRKSSGCPYRSMPPGAGRFDPAPRGKTADSPLPGSSGAS